MKTTDCSPLSALVISRNQQQEILDSNVGQSTEADEHLVPRLSLFQTVEKVCVFILYASTQESGQIMI